MEPIIEEFIKILTTESEENIRKWVVDNFDKFPEDWQSLLLGVFFEESLNLALQDLDERINYFSELLSAYEELSRAKRILENKLKELQIKEKLNEES